MYKVGSLVLPKRTSVKRTAVQSLLHGFEKCAPFYFPILRCRGLTRIISEICAIFLFLLFVIVTGEPPYVGKKLAAPNAFTLFA